MGVGATSGTLATVGVVVIACAAFARGVFGCGSSFSAAAPDARAPTATPIQHVVFLVKENRTFDVYFGKFPGANGATTGKLSDGGTIPLGHLYDRSSPDISHAWQAALNAYDDGGMDRFDIAS